MSEEKGINFDELAQALGDLDEDTVMSITGQVVEAGPQYASQAVQAMQKGMDTVGSLFEKGEYFVGDLIFSGEIMTEAMEKLKPLLKGSGAANYGKMILCTVKDDLHDIGKNIVKATLEAGGFEVVDLGIDVPPETIVQTAKDQNIKIIALSGVLTLALDSMKATVDAFKDAGMRDDVKIIIGGAPVTEAACQKIGADDWAIAPQKTLNVCKAWAEESGRAA